MKTDKPESLNICSLTDGCDTVRANWRASNRKAGAPQDEFGKFQKKEKRIIQEPEKQTPPVRHRVWRRV